MAVPQVANVHPEPQKSETTRIRRTPDVAVFGMVKETEEEPYVGMLAAIAEASPASKKS